MSGINYLFDTNTIIAFLGGQPNLQRFSSSAVCLSVVSVIEFLAFPQLNETDKNLLYEFVQEIEVVDLTTVNTRLIDNITSIRTSYKMKLPDAIIADTAIYKNAVLISNDKDFGKITSLNVLNF